MRQNGSQWPTLFNFTRFERGLTSGGWRDCFVGAAVMLNRQSEKAEKANPQQGAFPTASGIRLRIIVGQPQLGQQPTIVRFHGPTPRARRQLKDLTITIQRIVDVGPPVQVPVARQPQQSKLLGLRSIGHAAP